MYFAANDTLAILGPYWLTYEDQPGQRIERRDSGPGTSPQRTTGHEAGRWQLRTIYDSTRPGPDGDHWFANVLRSGPDQAVEAITIPLTTTLPIAAGSMTLTITGSASTAGPHQLEVTAGTASVGNRGGLDSINEKYVIAVPHL